MAVAGCRLKSGTVDSRLGVDAKSPTKMLRLVAGLVAVAVVTVLMDRYSFAGPQQPRLPARSFASEPAPGAEANNLFWVVQASGCGWHGVQAAGVGFSSIAQTR